MPRPTKDFLKYATKEQLQEIINRMYKVGGGTYEGAAYSYDSGVQEFNRLVNRRNYLQKHPETVIPVWKPEPEPHVPPKKDVELPGKKTRTETSFSQRKKEIIAAYDRGTANVGSWIEDVADKVEREASSLSQNVFEKIGKITGEARERVPSVVESGAENVWDTIAKIVGGGIAGGAYAAEKAGNWIEEAIENTGDWLGNAVGNLRKSLSFSSSPAKKSATMPGREISFTDTLFAPTSGHSEEEIRRIRKESRSADTTDIDNMNYQILRQAGASPEITEYVLSMIKRNRYGKGNPLILEEQKSGTIYYSPDGKQIQVIPAATAGKARNLEDVKEYIPLTAKQIQQYDRRSGGRKNPEIPGKSGFFQLFGKEYSWLNPATYPEAAEYWTKKFGSKAHQQSYQLVVPGNFDRNDPYLSVQGVSAQYLKPFQQLAHALHSGTGRMVALAKDLSYATPGCSTPLDPETGDAWENLYDYLRNEKIAGRNPVFATFWDLTGKEGY